MRYWKIKGIHGCAKEKFLGDLLSFIKSRKEKWGKDVSMLDENEDTQTGKLLKDLSQ